MAALGTAALTGAAPAAATTQTSGAFTAGAHSSLLPPDWYERGPYSTPEACRRSLQQEIESGVNGVRACHYEDRQYQWQGGYYYAVYLP